MLDVALENPANNTAVRRPADEAPLETPAAASQKHNRTLLRALQSNFVVTVDDAPTHLRRLTFQLQGGNVETTAYAVNETAAVSPKRIRLVSAGTQAGQEPASHETNRVLLHALHTAHPLMYQGLQRYIHSLTFERIDGVIDTWLYLTGSEVRVAISDVQLQSLHECWVSRLPKSSPAYRSQL